MSELKCPSCGQELKRDYYDCEMLECHNPKCKHYYDDFIGREELWQELIRTRKALDLALKCMNGVMKDLPWVKRTLDEIKTITEQKDKK